MAHLDISRQPGLDRSWIALGLIIFLFLCGCQAKEPPLSPGAAAFKQEMKECIDRVAGPLIGPVAQKNLGAINEALSQVEPQVLKLCRMCPFQIAVLDRDGDALATYPKQQDMMGKNFANFGLVAQVVKNRKTLQQRFFLQDGSEIYIIGVPLMRGKDLVGILAISLSAEEAKKRWDLTEKEFLALDLNK